MSKTRAKPRRPDGRPDVAGNIEAERLRLGMSRPELARRLGLDPSTVRYWAETGRAPRDVEAVAKVLGVTPAHLWRAA